MSDCTFCGEDAGEGHDLCIGCKNKKNEVTLGHNEPKYYFMKVVEKALHHDEIRVKFFFNKVDTFNQTIRPLLMSCGFEEIRRSIIHETNDKGEKTESILVRVERIPAMKGHIKDLRDDRVI